jgi:hypothetical protein
MKEFDHNLRKAVARQAALVPRGECPREEALAALVDGRLAETDQAEIHAHLARCPLCLDTAEMLRGLAAEAEKEERFRVPLSAIAKARALDPAGIDMIEVVVRFASGLAEVVKMSSGVVGGLVSAEAPVRGASKVVSATLVTFVKDFPPYRAEVDLERVKPDRGEITLRLTDPATKVAPEGVRVSLFDDRSELESAALDRGIAVFENLKFGKYRVEITRVGQPIGGITLVMKGEGK